MNLIFGLVLVINFSYAVPVECSIRFQGNEVSVLSISGTHAFENRILKEEPSVSFDFEKQSEYRKCNTFKEFKENFYLPSSPPRASP